MVVAPPQALRPASPATALADRTIGSTATAFAASLIWGVGTRAANAGISNEAFDQTK
jgi:hypothetical protein